MYTDKNIMDTFTPRLRVQSWVFTIGQELSPKNCLYWLSFHFLSQLFIILILIKLGLSPKHCEINYSTYSEIYILFYCLIGFKFKIQIYRVNFIYKMSNKNIFYFRHCAHTRSFFNDLHQKKTSNCT